MSIDWADALYDRRMIPPEFEDYDWQPDPEAEAAYYEADEGAECPVCKHPKPEHGRSCFIAGEFSMSYQKTSIDFSEEVPWDGL